MIGETRTIAVGRFQSRRQTRPARNVADRRIKSSGTRTPANPRGKPWKKHVIDDKTVAPAHGHPVDIDGDGDLDVLMAFGIAAGVGERLTRFASDRLVRERRQPGHREPNGRSTRSPPASRRGSKPLPAISTATATWTWSPRAGAPRARSPGSRIPAIRSATGGLIRSRKTGRMPSRSSSPIWTRTAGSTSSPVPNEVPTSCGGGRISDQGRLECRCEGCSNPDRG